MGSARDGLGKKWRVASGWWQVARRAGVWLVAPARPALHVWKLPFADYAARLFIPGSPLFKFYGRATPDARERISLATSRLRPPSRPTDTSLRCCQHD